MTGQVRRQSHQLPQPWHTARRRGTTRSQVTADLQKRRRRRAAHSRSTCMPHSVGGPLYASRPLIQVRTRADSRVAQSRTGFACLARCRSAQALTPTPLAPSMSDIANKQRKQPDNAHGRPSMNPFVTRQRGRSQVIALLAITRSPLAGSSATGSSLSSVAIEPEGLERRRGGAMCHSCKRDTELVARLGIRNAGTGRVDYSWWQCVDRRGCRLYRAGMTVGSTPAEATGTD